MNPVERDVRMLLECNDDVKSMENARTIVLPRAARHHGRIMKTAKRLGRTYAIYQDLLSDASQLRYAVRLFVQRYRALKDAQS